MDNTAIQNHVERLWDQSILPELTEYIRIPNKSPAFDPEWRAHGYMEQAVARFSEWATRQPIKGLALEVVRLEGRTPPCSSIFRGTRASAYCFTVTWTSSLR